jgi:hypothetical protein
MEKLDAVGHKAMFGDDDINFDLELERFGVDMNELKESPIDRVFRAWVEDWEEEARKKNDCVTEAQLLAKYKGLVFHDPDTGKHFPFGTKIWSFVEGEEMDGLLLVSVQMMRMTMSHLHWKLHVN